ncbi:MAG: DUF4214 domain-containing protein [Butyrivibrio sp.]|nr:DUF4214 domain-containing protein [Butyrivibrio sp.]
MKCFKCASAVKKIAVSFMAALVVCGSFSSALSATEDKHVVERKGKQFSALQYHTGKSIDLSHPNEREKVWDFANNNHYKYELRVDVLPHDEKVLTDLCSNEEGQYFVERLDTTAAEVYLNDLSFWEEITTGWIGFCVPKGGTGVKLVNNTNKKLKVELRFTKFDKVEMNDVGIMRLPVYKGEYISLSCKPAKYDNYAYHFDFYTDNTYTQKDTNNRTGGGAYDGSHLTEKFGDWLGDFGGRIQTSSYFQIINDGYMTISLVKDTDITDYNLVYNDGLYRYNFKADYEGYYFTCVTKGDKSYRDFDYIKKDVFFSYSNYHDITDSTFYLQYMPDISDCARVFDKYDSNGERVFLFTPTETKDYYFDSDNATFSVTSIYSFKTTKVDGLSPVHLEKGVPYAITATKENFEDFFTIVIGEELADGYQPVIGGLTSSAYYENDEPEEPAQEEPSQTTPTTPSEPSVPATKTFEDFVERLYVVALGRASEPDGRAHWCKVVGNGSYSGADCARFFLTSPEFNGRNLNDEDYLKVLYKTFFDRDAAGDPDGFNFWLSKINEWGRGRVLEGFIDSTEWCNICADYGVRSGAMTAKATKASKNATAFATRLYTECLGREPEEGGLNFWSLSLTNQERTGTQAAKDFFYSEEFISKGLSDDEYVTRLYKTFMGREPEADGKAHWLNQLSNGTMTRDQVFDFFSTCEEFTGICNSYAIAR